MYLFSGSQEFQNWRMLMFSCELQRSGRMWHRRRCRLRRNLFHNNRFDKNILENRRNGKDKAKLINPKSVIRAQSSKLFVLVLFPNDRFGFNDFVECINMTNNKTTTPPAAFRRHYMRYSPPYICPLAVDALLDNLSLSC